MHRQCERIKQNLLMNIDPGIWFYACACACAIGESILTE
jgi:hypothetical protein